MANCGGDLVKGVERFPWKRNQALQKMSFVCIPLKVNSEEVSRERRSLNRQLPKQVYASSLLQDGNITRSDTK